MIKKIISGLIVCLFSLVGFTYGSNHEQDFTVGLNKYGSNMNHNFEIGALPKGRFITDYLLENKAVFGYDNDLFLFWDLNQKLYMFNKGWQGEFLYFRVCQSADYSNGPVNCGNVEEITDVTNAAIGNFLKGLNTNDNVYFQDNYQTWSNWGSTSWCHVVQLCFDINSGSAVCYLATDTSSRLTHTNNCGISIPGNSTDGYTNYGLYNIYGLASDTTFLSFKRQYIGESPAIDYNYDPDTSVTFTGSNSVTIDNTIDNDINYFQTTRQYDPSMCYVGTNDLDSLFGTNGVTYTEGAGDTIFGLYYHLYSGYGSNRIFNVGAFINTWLQNYNTWLNPSGLRDYVAVYNGPDQNVTYIRSGATHPFLDKPAALYFFINVLGSDYVNENSPGESIAYYCDLVLRYDNYKDGSLNFNDTYNQLDDKVKDRINEYTSYHFGSNDNNGSYSIPTFSSGSIWGNLVKSGYNIPTDLNPTSLFKDFYNKIINLSDFYNPVTRVGILPWWIIYPMLFLILFRMLRH